MNHIHVEVPVLRNLLAHEQKARRKAEIALRNKSSELNSVQQELINLQLLLENKARERTTEIVEANSIDSTERKEFEDKQHRMEKRYNDLFNNSQALICTHDMSGRLLSVNPATCKLLQYSEEEMIGKKISEFIPANLRNGFADDYLPSIAATNKAQGVLCLTGKSGEKAYLLFQNYKVEEEGADPYVIGFSQDITERIHTQHDLLATKKATEDATHAKEIFLANLSHEIRTPLTGVLGIAGLLQKTELNERQQNFLKLIQESANNLLVIVNDVLDLEKIVAGKLKLEKIPFKIVDKVAITVQSFIYRAEEKGLAIIYQNAIPGDMILSGDPFRLSQVLNNILSNAVKFTERGNIIITTSIRSFKNDIAVVEFSIKDTGIGIGEEKMKKIFEPFEQANSTISRKYGGTGLGLTICKNLLQMLGGNLRVQSAENIGSTFTFDIPYSVVEEELKETGSPMEINYLSLGKKKVLLAEDVELNQFIAKHIMESWGFHVDIACDGIQAVRMVQENNYDLVLMDIQMPGMDGIEATHEIRKLSDPLKAKIPIIAVTANALKNDSETFIAAGMTDYLSKPFEEAGLFKVIARNCTNGESNKVHGKKNEPVIEERLSNEKLYDLTTIRAVSGGDEEFVKRMILLFIDTVPGNCRELNDHIKTENWDMICKTAHKLKSTLGSMGIHSVLEDVKSVERTAKKREGLETITQLVLSLNITIDKCIKQLEQEMGQQPG